MGMKLFRFLKSMKFALILLFLLALACGAGSFIMQGQTYSWYEQNYSQRAAALIMALGIDHVFSSIGFLILTLALCLNLVFCNVVRFPLLLKRMKTEFSVKTCHDQKGRISVICQNESQVSELFAALHFRHVEKDSDCLYACRNKYGIWGAWLCHVGILVLIAGYAFSQMTQQEYTAYGIPGEIRQIGETDYEIVIDDFRIQYREDGSVDQYIAKLTVSNTKEGTSVSGEAKVNSPMQAYGMTFYQNSTGYAATMTVEKAGEKVQENIVYAGDYKEIECQEGLVIMLNQYYPEYEGAPGYRYSVYYEGRMLGMNILKGNEVITIEDLTIHFHDPQEYTLIQIKKDPLAWLVLAGGLIILISLVLALYLQPQKLWAIKEADDMWHVHGSSVKGGVLFSERVQEEWNKVMEGNNVK